MKQATCEQRERTLNEFIEEIRDLGSRIQERNPDSYPAARRQMRGALEL